MFALQLGNVLANGRSRERLIAKPGGKALQPLPVDADGGRGKTRNSFGRNELINARSDGCVWICHSASVGVVKTGMWWSGSQVCSLNQPVLGSSPRGPTRHM